VLEPTLRIDIVLCRIGPSVILSSHSLSVVRPSVNISRDAGSLYLVEGFQ